MLSPLLLVSRHGASPPEEGVQHLRTGLVEREVDVVQLLGRELEDGLPLVDEHPHGGHVFHPLRRLLGREGADDGRRGKAGGGSLRGGGGAGLVRERVQQVGREQRGQVRGVHLVARLGGAWKKGGYATLSLSLH